jgi:anti-sigma B factor antagonist
MEYTILKDKNVQVLTLKGTLLADVQTREILQSASELIQDGDVLFVVDLKDLKFINSSGLGMLLTLLTKCRKAGGEVVLANVPEQVNNLLVITKLVSIFKTANSVSEAIGMLGA